MTQEDTMIVANLGNYRFTYRVAGVCMLDDHILLQTTDNVDFWFVPGGRCEIGETSIESLEREMREELLATVTVGRLIWTVENFFEMDNTSFHELSLYFEMNLPEDSPLRSTASVLDTTDAGTTIHFKWFPIKDICDLALKPGFLYANLRQIPPDTRHLIHQDQQ